MRNLIILAFILVFAIGSIATAGQKGPSVEGRYDGLYPVEFSTERDKQAIPPGVGPLDISQVLFTRPIDNVGLPWPDNTFDYDNNTIEQDAPEQIDALANPGDFLFHELLANKVDLLVSFRLPGGIDAGAGPDAVFLETPTGGTGTMWTQVDLDADAPGAMENLDGLEVWGPDLDDDAYMFSLIADVVLGGGTSIFYYSAPNSLPYLPQGVIQASCAELGYQGPDVDLDALMVYDASVDEVGEFDGVFGPDDEIIFSIMANGNWDGGEIVHYRAGTAAFLNHGGHLWNTAFDISGTFGVQTEEVDAIEAMVHHGVPSMTSYGMIVLALLILVSGLIVIYRRRRIARV